MCAAHQGRHLHILALAASTPKRSSTAACAASKSRLECASHLLPVGGLRCVNNYSAVVYMMSSEAPRPYGDPQTRQRILEATRELLVERGSGLTPKRWPSVPAFRARPSTCISAIASGSYSRSYGTWT